MNDDLIYCKKCDRRTKHQKIINIPGGITWKCLECKEKVCYKCKGSLGPNREYLESPTLKHLKFMCDDCCDKMRKEIKPRKKK